jgi:hypothetical protein
MPDRRLVAAATLVVVGVVVGAGTFFLGLHPSIVTVAAVVAGGIAAGVVTWWGVERPKEGMWIQRRK